jgi:hypothetical protein
MSLHPVLQAHRIRELLLAGAHLALADSDCPDELRAFAEQVIAEMPAGEPDGQVAGGNPPDLQMTIPGAEPTPTAEPPETTLQDRVGSHIVGPSYRG